MARKTGNSVDKMPFSPRNRFDLMAMSEKKTPQDNISLLWFDRKLPTTTVTVFDEFCVVIWSQNSMLVTEDSAKPKHDIDFPYFKDSSYFSHTGAKSVSVMPKTISLTQFPL